MTGNVFIVVEDVYAVDALRHLLRRHGVRIERSRIARLHVCSGKMERVVRAHLAEGRTVVIIVDAEDQPPEAREREIREKHRLGERVHVVVVDPCMEALACEALKLGGCREKPCSRGPLAAVDEYWRRRRGKSYRKSMLRRLLVEADGKGSLARVPEFKRLLELLRSLDP